MSLSSDREKEWENERKRDRERIRKRERGREKKGLWHHSWEMTSIGANLAARVIFNSQHIHKDQMEVKKKLDIFRHFYLLL